VSPRTAQQFAIDGWFTNPEPGSGEQPTLLGGRCGECGTFVFPPRDEYCPNPACPNIQLERVPLSRRGRVWSYTVNHYAPPPPYIAADPFEPYALAAVQLEREGMIVLGPVSHGVTVDDLPVGMEMQVEIDTLFHDDDGVEHVVYSWAPATPSSAPSTENETTS
jgi:uncharacterized OB-fold protein